MALTVRALDNFVGGSMGPASSDQTRRIVSPVTGELIAEAPDASRPDVDRAVGPPARHSRAGPRGQPGSARRSVTRSPI